MSTRQHTLADRVARAQQEMQTWGSRERAAMQLQGASDPESLGQSRTPHGHEQSGTPHQDLEAHPTGTAITDVSR